MIYDKCWRNHHMITIIIKMKFGWKYQSGWGMTILLFLRCFKPFVVWCHLQINSIIDIFYLSHLGYNSLTISSCNSISTIHKWLNPKFYQKNTFIWLIQFSRVFKFKLQIHKLLHFYLFLNNLFISPQFFFI